jgi:hypothetical protein
MEARFSEKRGYFSDMSKIEEIEHAAEQLPLKDFVELAVWVDRRRQQLEVCSGKCYGLSR